MIDWQSYGPIYTVAPGIKKIGELPIIEFDEEENRYLDLKRKSKENIFFIDENQIPSNQKEFLKEYFLQKISPSLVTIILSNNKIHDFKDNKAFLIVNLKLTDLDNLYALVELPKNIRRNVARVGIKVI